MSKLLAFLACAALIAVVWFASRRGAEPLREEEHDAPPSSPAAREELAAPSRFADVALGADARVEVGDEANRRKSAERGTPKTLVRGQVVDAATGSALPDGLELGVVCRTGDAASSFLGRVFGQHGVHLGAGGVFEVATSDPDTLTGRVVFWSSGTEILEGPAHRYADERAFDGSWRLALDVGWLSAIELVQLDGAELEATEARLLEVVDGEEHQWPEGRLIPGLLPVFVQQKASFAADPAHRRWLEVEADWTDGIGVVRARVEVPVRNGIQPEAIRVVMRAPTSAFGRVVDEGGAPIADARVLLVPRDAAPASSAKLAARTGFDGRFVFDEAWPGRFHARAALPFAPGELRPVELEPGVNDLGVFVVQRGRVGGTIAGSVIADGSLDDPQVLLTLRDRASGAEIVAITGMGDTGLSDGSSSFANFVFPDVPAGEYELALTPFDDRRYAPESFTVSPPSTELEFHVLGPVPVVHALVVRDARDHGILETASVAYRLGGRVLAWSVSAFEPLESYAGGELLVYAPDHRAARIGAANFVRASATQGALEPGQELRVADVALEPGFGLGIVARDGESPSFQDIEELDLAFGVPLSGVRVLADGEEVARTDDGGFALVSLDHAPAVIDCVLPGWRVLSTRSDPQMKAFWMARE